MNTRTTNRFAAALLAAATLIGPDPGTAQDITGDWTGPAHVGLEVGRPFFDGGDFGALTGFAYLSGVIGEGSTRFLFEIPFARGSIDEREGSSSVLGSPFVGVVSRLGGEGEDHAIHGAFGVRLPVPEGFEFGDDDYAVGIGVLGDPDKMEAYLVKTATLSGTLQVESPVAPTVTLVGQFDADALIYTGETDEDRVEVFAGWGGLARFEGSQAFGSAGLTGRFLLTEDGDDRIWHQLEGRIGLDLGSARPWVSGRIPVQGGFVEGLDGVFGAGVSIQLR